MRRGKKVLYIRIFSANYCCIESVLLWYQLYAKTLKKIGFKLNPYVIIKNKIRYMLNGALVVAHQATIITSNHVHHGDPGTGSQTESL